MPSARVEAAGGVLWRGDPAAPEVALVHRPRYDDWSLPKGKLDPGEHPLLAALREIVEETGFLARPGRRLGSLRYRVAQGDKRVRFWACEATGGAFVPNAEVDELRWADLPAALRRLSPRLDREVLARFATDTRRTRALVLVRHASAGDKHSWPGPDAERPLDPGGQARAGTIAALLTAYDVVRAGSADVRRCQQTLGPFAARSGASVAVLNSTTADAVDTDPQAGTTAVLDLLGTSGSAAWCGQREAIPRLAGAVSERLGGAVDGHLVRLPKGGLLVLHVDDAGGLAAAERLPG